MKRNEVARLEKVGQMYNLTTDFSNVEEVALLLEGVLNQQSYYCNKIDDVIKAIEAVEARLSDSVRHIDEKVENLKADRPTGRDEKEAAPVQNKVEANKKKLAALFANTVKNDLKATPKAPENIVFDENPTTSIDGHISRDCRCVVIRGWGLYEGCTFDGIVPPDDWDYWKEANDHLKSTYIWSVITPDGTLKGWRSKRDRVSGQIVTGAKKSRKARKA